MPFDGTTSSPAHVNRARLIEALRSPLPDDFPWDFRGAETCALGLAHRLGITNTWHLDDVYHVLGLTGSHHVFACDTACLPLYGVPPEQVTPAMVADKLEEAPFA